MSFFSGAELAKTVEQSNKKKQKSRAPALSDMAPKKLLEIAKARIDVVYGPLVETANELEQKRNSVVNEIAQFEISQKKLPEEEKKPVPTTAWDFVEKRCVRKEKETESAHKKRKKDIMEMMQEFITEELFNDDKAGRIMRWFKKRGLVNLEFFETAGGMFCDDGKPARASQEDLWSQVMRHSFGVRILGCIAATDKIKELLSKIVVLAGYHDEDTDRQERYFQQLYAEISKDLFFGPQKEQPTETRKRKSHSKHEDDDDDDDDFEDEEADDDDEDEDNDAEEDESDDYSQSSEESVGEEKKETKKKRRKTESDDESDGLTEKSFEFVGNMVAAEDDDSRETNFILNELARATDLNKKRICYALWKHFNVKACDNIKNSWIGCQSIELSNAEKNQLREAVNRIYARESAAKPNDTQQQQPPPPSPPPPPMSNEGEIKVCDSVATEEVADSQQPLPKEGEINVEQSN